MSDTGEQNPHHSSPFDAIRHTDEHEREYWSARDLYKLLGYSTWQKFQKVISQAEQACEQSGQSIADHFNRQVNMITAGKGAQRSREDYSLSRYACYLIIQNADPSKPIVGLGQTYFAVQTRRPLKDAPWHRAVPLSALLPSHRAIQFSESPTCPPRRWLSIAATSYGRGWRASGWLDLASRTRIG